MAPLTIEDLGLALLLGWFFHVLVEWLLHRIIAANSHIQPRQTHNIFPVWTLFVSAGYAFADWYKQEACPTQRKHFLRHCNAWNLIFSGFYLCTAWVVSQTVPTWLPWLVGFAAWRFVSRCLEIAYAFGLDVLNRRQNRSGLDKYERLKLALFSYAELYLLAAGLYLSTPLADGKIYCQPFRAVIASLSVGSLTNVAYVVGEPPSAWQLLPFLQVFATLSLVVLSLTIYVSWPEESKHPPPKVGAFKIVIRSKRRLRRLMRLMGRC